MKSKVTSTELRAKFRGERHDNNPGGVFSAVSSTTIDSSIYGANVRTNVIAGIGPRFGSENYGWYAGSYLSFVGPFGFRVGFGGGFGAHPDLTGFGGGGVFRKPFVKGQVHPYGIFYGIMIGGN